MIDDPERLRDRATRLLALAIMALEEGNGEYTNQLTGMASDVLFHAEEIERRYRPWQQDASPQYAAH